MVVIPFTHQARWGLATPEGRVHVAPVYERIEALMCGRRLIVRDGRYGFLDEEGHEVIPARLSFAWGFTHGLAMASAGGTRYGALALDGSWALAPEFGELRIASTARAASRGDDGKWGILELPSGRWVVEPRWKAVESWRGGHFAVRRGARVGAVNLDGEEVLPAKWHELRSHDDGTFLAREKKDSPWLILSRAGEILHRFDPKITSVFAFSGRSTPARRGRYWGVVDRDGTWSVEPQWSEYPVGDGRGPWRTKKGGKYGYEGAGVSIAPKFREATVFADGFAWANGSILDATGAVVAKVNPREDPSVPIPLSPPPEPKGRSAQALVTLLRESAQEPVDRDVLQALARVPDPDLAAVLHAWWSSKTPSLCLGNWELSSGTDGKELEKALREGRPTLPLGHGPYYDPVVVSFEKGRAKIRLDSNPEDTAPRNFHGLDSFLDSMIEEALEDGLHEPWPLPDMLRAFLEAGGLPEPTKLKLLDHVAGVAAGGGPSAEEAQALHDAHAPVPVQLAERAVEFRETEALVTTPQPPDDVAALLTAGGHAYFVEGPESTWVAVHRKGIRFIGPSGKRKAVNSKAEVQDGGPTVAFEDSSNVLLCVGRNVVRVSLPSGKQTAVLSLSEEDAEVVTATLDGRQIVAVVPDDDSDTTRLAVYDTDGEKQREFSIPAVQYASAIRPIGGDLFAVWGTFGAVIVDLVTEAPAGVFDDTVFGLVVGTDRATLVGGTIHTDVILPTPDAPAGAAPPRHPART